MNTTASIYKLQQELATNLANINYYYRNKRESKSEKEKTGFSILHDAAIETSVELLIKLKEECDKMIVSLQSQASPIHE